MNMRLAGSIALFFIIGSILIAGCAQLAVEVKTTTTPQVTTPAVHAPMTSSIPTASQTTVTVTPATTSPSLSTCNGRYVDVHSHIRPDGMDYPRLISAMDREGIDMMVIMEPPGAVWLQSMTPEKYGIPDAGVKYPNRFITLCSGDAGKMLYTAAKTGKYTPDEEVQYKVLLADAAREGTCRGFGEIGVRHFPPDGMPQTYDITVPADHPWMFDMCDVAGEYGIPVDIHMEATSGTVAGLERLLAHNRNATIIWDHAGWGNSPENSPALMRRLLSENSNLFSSIKFRKDMAGTGFLAADGTINPAWLAVVEEYPNRFMMGSDIKPGIWENEFRQVKDHVSILSQLPPDIQNTVARENAIRIFRIT
ncbi:MAG: amidohydrolase family protein [Methanoregula sp.]